ncbi:MAG: DUF4129 domain-containing protein [Zetaproteobacteria bacterium]|nr:MAG: DUF4129 domain-containing protein [Zetaproteobacteria bacterium]
MSGGERLLLGALTGVMELSWLCAWTTFAAIGVIGRPFPLFEATVAFAGVSLLTRLSSGKGWRVAWVASVQGLGLLGGVAGILHGLYYPDLPFYRQAWALDFLGASRSFSEWLILILVLACAVFFWLGGVRLAVRPLAYNAVCARFDLGFAAFALLFLVKWLVTANGGQVDDRISHLFLLPFFVASLLAIGTIQLRSDGRKAFLSGYRGVGVFLTFTTGALLVAATLALFSLPYLTLAAEAGFVVLKGAGMAVSPFLLWVLRFLFAPQTLRADPAPPRSRDNLSIPPALAEQGWWVTLVEKLLVWSAGIALALAVAALLGIGLYLLIRFLLSRTSGRPGRREPVSPLGWLRRLGLFLSGIRARLAGLRCARDGYRRLLAWARRSGLPPVPADTPSEIGARLQRRFPTLRAEIGSIVDAFVEETYREVILPSERTAEVRSAWRRLRSPRQWPARIKVLWRGA